MPSTRSQAGAELPEGAGAEVSEVLEEAAAEISRRDRHNGIKGESNDLQWTQHIFA